MGNSKSLNSRNYGDGGNSLAFLQDLFHITSSDLNSLHSIYCHSLNIGEESSLHHSSRIHYLTFCSFIHCEENIFTGHLFSFFSSFQSRVNSLTFNEFILYIYFFLSLDENHLIEFVYFLILDHYSDQKKHLPSSSNTPLTIEQSLHHLFGNEWGDPQQIHHILSIFDHDLHGELTFEEFQKGLQTNRSLLFRIASYQMDIQKRIFSESYWKGRVNGVTSQMIRDLRKIRNELHQLEREDFLQQTPPPPLEDLQLKPLSDRKHEAEALDPRLVSLPVSRHKKDSHHKLDFYARQPSNSSHDDDLSHLPPLREATPPPVSTPHLHLHHKLRHEHSSPLPELSIPEDSSIFHTLPHPSPLTNQTDAVHHPPTRSHSISSGVTEGSSQIHTLQRLKTLHHHHSSADVLYSLRPLSTNFPPPAHHDHALPEVNHDGDKNNSLPPNQSTHTVRKSHSLHHHHSTASATSSSGSDAN
jgi:hypothetical protein